MQISFPVITDTHTRYINAIPCLVSLALILALSTELILVQARRIGIGVSTENKEWLNTNFFFFNFPFMQTPL